MKEDKGFTLALSWIIGGLAAAAICYGLGSFFGVTKDAAPAWVQAVGSIGAIAFAWFMSSHHQRVQEQQRRKDELRQLIQTAMLCEVFVRDSRAVLSNVHGKFHDSFIDQEWDEIGTERLHGLLSAMDSLFAKDISSGLLSALLPVQREVAYTLTAVRQYNEGQIPASEARGEKALRRLNEVRKAHDIVKAIVLLHRMSWGDLAKK